MSELPDPLSNIFKKIADGLAAAPEMIRLPRDEFIRFAHSQFYVGAASLMQGVCAFIMAIPEGVDTLAAMEAFIDTVSPQILGQSKMTLSQTLATINANKPENAPQ